MRLCGEGAPAMRTTLNIDATVARRLREEAARRETTMSALVEAGVRRILDDAPPADKRPLRPLPTWDCGGSLVNVADRDELHRAMEEEG